MGDKEERNEILENHEERKGVPRRRVRSNPLNFPGEQYTLSTLPQGVFLFFSRDKIMDPKRHMDKFLSICDVMTMTM
jgi:hypothetical protein